VAREVNQDQYLTLRNMKRIGTEYLVRRQTRRRINNTTEMINRRNYGYR